MARRLQLCNGRRIERCGRRLKLCEDEPGCDHWYRATLCGVPPTCPAVPEEVYVRCDYGCVSGGGDVLKIGPFSICYRVDRAVPFRPDPRNGQPAPPGEPYLPPNAWLVDDLDFECAPGCESCAPAPQRWYSVTPCECDPYTGAPIYMDCQTYHGLIQAARAHGDPLACYAFSASLPGGIVVCFVLDGGVVYEGEPIGHKVVSAGLVVGGCCACAGCYPTCERPALQLIDQASAGGGVCTRNVQDVVGCCCNPLTAVSRAESIRRFYRPPSAGGGLAITETTLAVLEAGVLNTTTSVEYHLEGRIEKGVLTTVRQACDRDAVYVNAGWQPTLCAQDAVGTLKRDCAGGRALYSVYGLDGTNRYLAVTVDGTATHGGDLGPCDGGCVKLPGTGPGDSPRVSSPVGPAATGGCHGCGGGAGPGSSPEAIEAFLRG